MNSKKKGNNDANNLLKQRIDLKKDLKSVNIDENMKEKIKERIKQIESDVGDKVAEENVKDIVETIKKLGGDKHSLGGAGRKQMWGLLKKKYPKRLHVTPVGKKDKSGNLITNHDGLKQLYLQTYTQRLRNRPMKPEFEEINMLKNKLFNLRLNISEKRRSKPWVIQDLEVVLKDLKSDKARDPNGLVNEIFKDDVAGYDLKVSMLLLFNRIKANNHIPEFIRHADVATIYKGKGEKCDLKNDRGIFLVTTFRSILMKLIYRDKYDLIDNSMSDSQIGSRKRKSIRNHIWVINGIISDVLSTKKKNPIDIQIFDYKQCFDSLWLEECMNDMFQTIIQCE